MTLNTKSIRFPTDSYVGFDPRPNDEDVFPLGFMTEDGTDKAAMKRKATVDNWASKTVAPRSLPNTPMVGFRLSRQIRRNSGWGSGNVKWRIEDPRGFELEISSPNLAQIVASCVIENGEILDECMWARLGGDNVLVPTSSELYKTTKENSERLKKSVKPSSVKIGNRVVLKNGIEGIYCGKCYEIERDWQTPYRFVVNGKPKHVILSMEEDGKKIAHAYAGFKPASIIDENTMSDIEVEKLIFEHRYLREKMSVPPVETRPLDPTEVADFDGLMIAQIPEFDNEWCLFEQPNTYNGETKLTAICENQLRGGIIMLREWFASQEAKDRLSAVGIRIDYYSGYYGSRNRLTKSGSTKLDYSKLKIETPFRTWVTPLGNTFVRPIRDSYYL